MNVRTNKSPVKRLDTSFTSKYGTSTVTENDSISNNRVVNNSYQLLDRFSVAYSFVANINCLPSSTFKYREN